MLHREGDRLRRVLERELVADQPTRARRGVALDELRRPPRTRRRRSSRRPSTSSSFSVKLPIRSVTSSPDIPTCTTRPGGGDHVDGARTAAGAPVASMTTGGTVAARPVARGTHDLVGVVQGERLGAQRALEREAALRGSTISTSRAAVAREQAQRLPDRPGAEDHDALAAPRRGRGAWRRTAIDTGSASAASAGVGASIGNTWSAGMRSAPAGRRRRGCRSARSCRTRSGARRGTGSSDRTASAATAPRAGPTAGPHGSPGRRASIVAADLVPLDARELRAAGAPRSARRRRSGSRSRRCRPRRGARRARPARARPARGPRGPASSPTASVTAASTGLTRACR